MAARGISDETIDGVGHGGDGGDGFGLGDLARGRPPPVGTAADPDAPMAFTPRRVRRIPI